MLRKETVSNRALGLLMKIMNNPAFAKFSLVGGTALALQYGHRKSEDLDLFSTEPFDIEEFIQTAKNILPEFHLYQETTIGLRATFDKIKVYFLKYPYPILLSNIIEGVRIYSPEDIAAMKIKSIGNRGAKKDFFDLNELLQHFTLTEILEFFKTKYNMTDIGHYFIFLTYFEDAALDHDPVILNKVTWKEVKNNIHEKVNAYLKNQIKE